MLSRADPVDMKDDIIRTALSPILVREGRVIPRTAVDMKDDIIRTVLGPVLIREGRVILRTASAAHVEEMLRVAERVYREYGYSPDDAQEIARYAVLGRAGAA